MPADTTISPSRAEFLRLAATHSLVPVYRTLTADLETPVSAFLRLASDEPQSFLLESVEGGEKVGRYTFIGVRPYRTILSRGSSIVINERGKTRSLQGDVFALLKELLAGQKPAHIAGLPPFTSGAVGFFAYDVVRQLERLPELAEDDLGIPDACLMFFDEVLAFDHVRKQIQLMVTADLSRQKPAAAYADAKQRLGRLEKRLARPLPKPRHAPPRGKLSVTSHTLKKDFLASVARIKEYIAAGDIFQAVLSQRFEVKPGVDPFSIYRALRIVNPSPYLYFLRFDLEKTSLHLPGGLVSRIAGARAAAPCRVPPIAGTRPRSANEEEDLRIEQELLANEKERAEHVMLVDLGRNDIGRVCEFGTVRVKSLMHVERYSHVMHLVSALEGQLRKGLSAVDAFCACFPAGTLSGAPKIRAMEIIEELEPTRRGIYGGSVFYADFSGNFDSCIAIRSMLLKGRAGLHSSGRRHRGRFGAGRRVRGVGKQGEGGGPGRRKGAGRGLQVAGPSTSKQLQDAPNFALYAEQGIGALVGPCRKGKPAPARS
jgi:anthranilate synthase component 1